MPSVGSYGEYFSYGRGTSLAGDGEAPGTDSSMLSPTSTTQPEAYDGPSYASQLELPAPSKHALEEAGQHGPGMVG